MDLVQRFGGKENKEEEDEKFLATENFIKWIDKDPAHVAVFVFIDELFDELPLTGGLEKQYCFAIEQVFYELRYVKDEDDMNIVISCDYVDQDTYLDFLISQRK